MHVKGNWKFVLCDDIFKPFFQAGIIVGLFACFIKRKKIAEIIRIGGIDINPGLLSWNFRNNPPDSIFTKDS